MAKPLTDDERQRIVALLGEGKSAQEIADEIGRGKSSVARVAASVGHSWGQSNTARAHEARSAYCAERRANIAASLTVKAEELLAQMDAPHLAYNFGGKDNTYEEHLLERPPVDAQRALVQSIRECVRTIIDIDRHDNRNEEGLAAVDAWLRDIAGGAT